MKFLFIRRPKLGISSLKGICQWINSNTDHEAKFWTSGEDFPHGFEANIFIRWGATPTIPTRNQQPILNKARAIHKISRKGEFSKSFFRFSPSFQPICMYSDSPGSIFLPNLGTFERIPVSKSFVVRPLSHSRGVNLEVVQASTFWDVQQAVINLPAFADGWYARELINKQKEYRVFVVHNRVVAVSEKIPDDSTQVVWNRGVNSSYQNVRWSDWPLSACKIALDACQHAELDFGGIDIMEDEFNRCYFLEGNSGPSLKFRPDGSLSYNQKVMAQALSSGYSTEEFEVPSEIRSFHSILHPSRSNS